MSKRANGLDPLSALGGGVLRHEGYQSHTHYLALREAVAMGVGVGIIGDVLAAPWVDDGRLVRVWPQWRLPRARLWAVYPAGRSIPARLRLLLDLLVAGFSARGGT
ncbi:MAG: hypothetical protein KC912_10700 [Proteobacteria bacterium]|nr:hypothetical protein [Pseudomonadota bacterium]